MRPRIESGSNSIGLAACLPLTDPSFMAAPRLQPLQLHHHVVAVDLDLDGFGDIRPLHDSRAGLDRRRIRPRAKAAGVAIGLPGADIEFPAMPGAADDLAEFCVFDLAWRI